MANGTSQLPSSDLDARWPRWPEGDQGKAAPTLLHVVLDLPVDQAFLLLFGGLNELGKAFNEAAGNKEYTTTSWVDGADAVQAAAVGPTPAPLRDVQGLRAGMLRRASYSGSMMGSKYRNEELHRLQEARAGAAYQVTTTVLTTAMHGEKFRPVVMSSLTALQDGRTEYMIRSTILFITKPNGFIKAMIDKGARDGQRKNFEALKKVLGQFTTVTEAAEVQQPSAAAAAAVVEPTVTVPSGAEAAAAPAAGMLEAVCGSVACHRLDPWATYLHTQLAAAAPAVGDLLQPRTLLAALALLALLGTLRVVVDMLLFIQNASIHPRDTVSLVTHYTFKVVDVPDSIQEVVLSCLIFYTVRLLVNRLAGMLPPPPTSAPTAAPGPPSVPTGPAPSELTGVRSEEQEAEGIKYEGYAEAIAAAQAQSLSPVAAGLSAAGTAGGSAAEGSKPQGSTFMQGFTKSISGAFTPTRVKKVSPTASDASLAAAVTAAHSLGKISGSSGIAGADVAAGSQNGPQALPRRASRLSDDQGLRGSQQSLQSTSSTSVAPNTTAIGDMPLATAAATSPPSQSPLTVPRSLSESAANLTAALTEGEPGGSLSPPGRGYLTGELPPGTALSPPRSSSPALEQRLSGSGFAQNLQDVADPSSSSVTSFFLGKKSRGLLSPSAVPASPQESKRTDAVEAQMLSPTAAQRDFRPAMPAHLPPGLASAAVIEEVFENQRLQPFRGWGSTWPGHFLPTDKVNHWSRREHEGFPVLAGPDFQAIAPPLPEGWQWCEEKWHLDLSAQIIDACDGEGWSYGLDFPFVKHPFQPNSGTKRISDFVRRRRWIRTRVPLELAQQPRLTAIAADSSSWSEVGGGAPAPTVPGAKRAAAVENISGTGAAERAADGAAGTAAGSEDESQVHAVVGAMFAQAIARSDMEASIQDAMAQQIGSRDSRSQPAVDGARQEMPGSFQEVHDQPLSAGVVPGQQQTAAAIAEPLGPEASVYSTRETLEHLQPSVGASSAPQPTAHAGQPDSSMSGPAPTSAADEGRSEGVSSSVAASAAAADRGDLQETHAVLGAAAGAWSTPAPTVSPPLGAAAAGGSSAEQRDSMLDMSEGVGEISLAPGMLESIMPAEAAAAAVQDAEFSAPAQQAAGGRAHAPELRDGEDLEAAADVLHVGEAADLLEPEPDAPTSPAGGAADSLHLVAKR